LALAALAWLAAWAALGLRLARSALPNDGDFLQWDGMAWTLGLRSPGQSSATPAGLRLDRLVLALDLGAWVLLRLHSAAGGQRWQVARASRAGTDWHGLRLALTAHAGRAAAPAGAST
jgi:hypothetical protein